MNIISMPRGSGKTTKLIYVSEVTGFPILVNTIKRQETITDMAQSMGIDIPKPILIYDTRKRGRINFKDNPVLIDDVESILEEALESYVGQKICAVSTSIGYKR